MLKLICFALVCENTCTREVTAPEKKQHRRIIKIQWNLPSWNTSDIPLSTNVNSCIIHSYFPLSNPSSRLGQQVSFFSSPSPSKTGRGVKHPAADRTGFSSFPLPPIHSPHRKANSGFILDGQPLSARTFWRLTLQCVHHLSTWLTDPKLPSSTAAPRLREEPRPSFSSSSTKTATSPRVSIVNKNTRSRHRRSRWLMCRLPAQTGPAVPIATPSYRSCNGHSAPSHTPVAATMQSLSTHFYAFGANCWQFFSPNPMPDGFCLGLDLRMTEWNIML